MALCFDIRTDGALRTYGPHHSSPRSTIQHYDRFSGDAIPSDNLIQAGRGVSVLIHEASLSDDEEELAVAKQHSTVGQAIDVGRR